ncbi:MAG: phosphate-starvation-inducible PsiE family protein [Acidimicrobiales bacterium]
MTENDGRPPRQRFLSSIFGISETTAKLERAQDVVTVLIGVVLIILAATILVTATVDFLRDVQHHSVAAAGETLLDRVLLVLILVEVVHTVVLSLRAHSLVAQPFIVVGLVAVIRRILLILSNTASISTSQFALLLAMVVVFIAGLVVVNRFEHSI